MISIGAAYRGPELRDSEIARLIMAVARVLKDLQGPSKLGDAPSVVAVFMVPGSLGGFDFKGLRYGNYSKKDCAIVVQIAVPAEVIAASDVVAFLIDSLHGANAMAFEFFRKRGESFPLREAENLLVSTADLLVQGKNPP